MDFKTLLDYVLGTSNFELYAAEWIFALICTAAHQLAR
jgi:hypothetical protein